MKKIIFILAHLFFSTALFAQQYQVYATPAGVIKPLPNGATVAVATAPGGNNGQVQWNNSGALAGTTFTGDVLMSAPSGLPFLSALTIQSGVVTNAKLANMPENSFKANNTGSSASGSDISVSQAKTLLAITTSDVSGLGSMASQNSNNVLISGGAIANAAVTGLPAPVNPNDAARLTDLSSISAGLTQRTGVVRATATALAANTYNNGTAGVGATLTGNSNGAITVDGGTPSASDRIMVKNEAATANNGIYVVTTVGSGGAPYVLTRATDSDTAAELKVGYYYFVSSGTANGSSGWTIQSPAPATIGTDPVTFSQFSASASYTASTGVKLVGSVFQADASTMPTLNQSTTGNALTATTATVAGSVTDTVSSSNSTNYIHFSNSSTGGNNAVFKATNLTYNPSTGALTAPSFVGALTGNATTASTASTTIGIGVTNDSSTAGTVYPMWAVGASSSVAAEISTSKLTFNPSTGVLSSTSFTGAGTGLTGTAASLTAGNVTTNANLTGDVTSIGNATTVVKINGTSLAGLGTGILKNTTGTGIPSIAVAGDFPTLNQNTTGSAATLTTTRTIGGSNFNGSANVISFPAPGAIGGTTPSTAVFTTITPSTAANGAITKANYNITVINVKDYGAVGNGSTADQTAISAAIAAMTSHSALYFPPGKYRITSGLGGFSGLSYIKVFGDGAEIYNDTGASGTNTFVFDTGCSNVEVCNLSFTGTSSVRANGIHIRMAASNCSIHDCYFQGCSDFGVLVSYGNGAWLNNAVIANNIFDRTLGDGLHIGSATEVTITGNTFIGTGDDGIGVVADYAAYQPNRVTISGNTISYAGSTSYVPTAVSGCGIRVDEATDVTITGNEIYTPHQSGILLARNSSTTAYNARIHITGNKIFNAQSGASGSGSVGSIWIKWTNQCSVSDNQVIDPAAQSGIAFKDVNDLTIRGNFIRKCPSRSITVDANSEANVATSWTDIYINNNDIDWTQANEAIWIVPFGSSITLTNVMICGNTGQIVGSPWIYTDHISTGRIYNNTNQSSATVTDGGHNASVTTGNNNG